MCLLWIWEQTAIISLYSINWLVLITETECLLRGTFCPHSVFMYFVWIWERTAIISLYSINWFVFITELVCLLRGTNWTFKHKFMGRAMARAVRRLTVTTEDGVWFEASPCAICGGQSDSKTLFSASICFPLSVLFHKCSTLIFIYALLLSKWQACKAWELSKT
jgi:hypothetical protein